MAVTILSIEEARRRIQERDHAEAGSAQQMGFANEQTLIQMVEEGIVEVAVNNNNVLLFRQGPNFDAIRPE